MNRYSGCWEVKENLTENMEEAPASKAPRLRPLSRLIDFLLWSSSSQILCGSFIRCQKEGSTYFATSRGNTVRIKYLIFVYPKLFIFRNQKIFYRWNEATNMYRTFSVPNNNRIYSSKCTQTSFRIDYILGHKTNLKIFKKLVIMPNIFF